MFMIVTVALLACDTTLADGGWTAYSKLAEEFFLLCNTFFFENTHFARPNFK